MIEPDQDRRLKMTKFPAQRSRLLGNLMDRWFCLTGLPADAEIVNISYLAETDEWGLLLRSDEFPIVPPNVLIPPIDLQIKTREAS